MINATITDNDFTVEVAVQILDHYKYSITSGDLFTVVIGIFYGGNTLAIEEVKVEANDPTGSLPPLV